MAAQPDVLPTRPVAGAVDGRVPDGGVLELPAWRWIVYIAALVFGPVMALVGAGMALNKPLRKVGVITIAWSISGIAALVILFAGIGIGRSAAGTQLAPGTLPNAGSAQRSGVAPTAPTIPADVQAAQLPQNVKTILANEKSSDPPDKVVRDLTDLENAANRQVLSDTGPIDLPTRQAIAGLVWATCPGLCDDDFKALAEKDLSPDLKATIISVHSSEMHMVAVVQYDSWYVKAYQRQLTVQWDPQLGRWVKSESLFLGVVGQ